MMNPSPTSPESFIADDAALVRVGQLREKLLLSVSHSIVGQQEVLDQVIITILCGGHCLIEGVPGLAKTLMIRSLAKAMSLSFGRIQFTPDLMPSDIIGTEVIQENRGTGERSLHFLAGPIFAQMLLADEINRSPPKTQSALLEAMQECQVSVSGTTHPLPTPFFVLATQNPIEQEGTYPLPEAQLDRFMLLIRVNYPNDAEELEIVRRTTSKVAETTEPVVDVGELVFASTVVRSIPVAEHLLKYAIQLVRASRPDTPEAPAWVRELVRYGAGPRGSQFLVLAAKARAALAGRPCVELNDIQAMALPVLRHRLVPSFEAENRLMSTDEIITRLIDSLSTFLSGEYR